MATNITPNQPPLTVLMEDSLVHTNEHPFCDDTACPCGQDHDLIREYLLDPLTAGLLTQDEAVRLYKNKQI